MIDPKALQKLMSYTRRAIDSYSMIEEGDRIAVGVSGGKDSLALLCALQGLKRFYPKNFEIVPINLRMGFPNETDSVSRALCEELGLELVSVPSEIYAVVFEVRKEKHPCSLCANMRRGALHNAAKEAGCNKLALGHHFDDAVETIIMNLFIEGRFDCFRPVTYLDRSDMTVIRPLLFTPEKEVSHFVRASNIVPVPKNCPADGNTRREEAKNALNELERNDRGVKQRIFNAYFGSNSPFSF
ncbi:MAG: tRNA 2-thiocytidine(32) synthetase TtcA [Clostridia bacterium]|nr:tRNA 2-thiocytidine(32) synthetase TtcA [Clostridia bacterium]MBR6783686.1 tRNA 2-thiocytidine(32) synthetase TtcA [Clostridia bacterium]